MPVKKILIRAPKAPDTPVSPLASLAHGPNGVFGSNAGNLLFAQSVYRAVSTPDAEVVPDSFSTERPGSGQAHARRIDDEFDLFIVPLANAFREQFRPALRRLTAVIRQLSIPVVVTGVGAQLPVSGAVDGVSKELRVEVTEFVRAVLERSASIGVRGETTARFLRHLGFSDSDVQVIGCPSLFDFGEEVPVVEKQADGLSQTDPIALNVTPTAPWAKELLAHQLRTYQDCVYIPQEHPELALLLWQQPILGRKGAFPRTSDDPWLTADRIRFFVDAKTWHTFLHERVFSFGHRIHGNIAALAAGTPACVLAFDSRTSELADYHGIPTIAARSLDREAVDASAIYDRTDLTQFNARRGTTRNAWLQFLDANEVPNVGAISKTPLDERIAAAGLPPGVGPCTDDDFSARVRWLHNEIQTSNPERYQPPFAPPAPRSIEQHLNTLSDRHTELARRVEQLEAENDVLRSALAAHGGQDSPASEPRARRFFRAPR